jgi:hypothetical protein
MYCPYCGIDHDDATIIRSVEHIVPYGIGGSDSHDSDLRQIQQRLGLDRGRAFYGFLCGAGQTILSRS